MKRYFLLICFWEVTLFVFSGEQHTFSVNDHGGKVIFSPGNLQYNAMLGTHLCADGKTKKGTWRFAERQYDYVGGTEYYQENGHTCSRRNGIVRYNNQWCNNCLRSENYDGWIDLFAFATSGWDNTANDPYAINFEPWSFVDDGEPSNTPNSMGYGPSANMEDTNIVGTSAYYDWGIYNQIGEDAPGTWRILTIDEWDYIFNKRPNAGQLWGYGRIYDWTDIWYQTVTDGIIILPDDWITPPNVSFAIQGSFYENTYDTDDNDDWEKMEKAGAVFLPMTGHLSHNLQAYDEDEYDLLRKPTVNHLYTRYWSSTNSPGSYKYTHYQYSYTLLCMAKGKWFCPDKLFFEAGSGNAVRLVKDDSKTPAIIQYLNDTIHDTICQGTAYRDIMYTQTGTFTTNIDTLIGQAGTDTIVTYDLHVLPAYNTMVYDTIQEGTYYSWRGRIFSPLAQQNAYYDSLQTIHGCDSIFTLNLIVVPAQKDTVFLTYRDTICQGTNYRDIMYTQTGTFTTNIDTLIGQAGTDTIVTYDLYVLPAYNTMVYDTIQEGTYYSWRGRIFSPLAQQNTYYDSLQTIHGCDSIFTLNLIVVPAQKDTVFLTYRDTICQGTNYRDIMYTQTGTFTTNIDTLIGQAGTDTIVTYDLYVLPAYNTMVYDTIQEGTYYSWRGRIFSPLAQQNTYYDSLQTIHGCDSIFTLNLMVVPESKETAIKNNTNKNQPAVIKKMKNGQIIIMQGNTVRTILGKEIHIKK